LINSDYASIAGCFVDANIDLGVAVVRELIKECSLGVTFEHTGCVSTSFPFASPHIINDINGDVFCGKGACDLAAFTTQVGVDSRDRRRILVLVVSAIFREDDLLFGSAFLDLEDLSIFALIHQIPLLPGRKVGTPSVEFLVDEFPATPFYQRPVAAGWAVAAAASGVRITRAFVITHDFRRRKLGCGFTISRGG